MSSRSRLSGLRPACRTLRHRSLATLENSRLHHRDRAIHRLHNGPMGRIHQRRGCRDTGQVATFPYGPFLAKASSPGRTQPSAYQPDHTRPPRNGRTIEQQPHAVQPSGPRSVRPRRPATRPTRFRQSGNSVPSAAHRTLRPGCRPRRQPRQRRTTRSTYIRRIRPQRTHAAPGKRTTRGHVRIVARIPLMAISRQNSKPC